MTPNCKPKTMMASQRDRGGHNRAGHKHPLHLAKTASVGNGKPVPTAPALQGPGVVQSKARRRP